VAPLIPASSRIFFRKQGRDSRETLKASNDEAAKSNDQAVFASRFEGVTTLARHSLSQAVVASSWTMN
jgi:hypothetical protein